MVHGAPRPLTVIREVFRTQGIRGFWNGQTGTLIRETGGSAAWFGSKETVTLLFHHLNSKSITSNPAIHSQSDSAHRPALPLWQQAVAGASAGMAYNFLFFPADTIKSRMQTSVIRPGSPPLKFWKEGMLIWRRYGLQGLYRGCGITVARSAPSSAFIFIIFDALKANFHLA
jgi:ornithine carrier protein